MIDKKLSYTNNMRNGDGGNNTYTMITFDDRNVPKIEEKTRKKRE